MRIRLLTVLLALSGALFAVDTQLLNLLPPGAKVLGGIDFAGSRNTPFGDYVLERMERHAGHLDRFASETGLDVRTGLISLVAGGTGLSRESSGVVAFRGNFQRESILQYATGKGAQTTTYAGVPMIVGDHERSPALAFPLADVGVFGRPDSVRAAIDRWNAGSGFDPAVAAQVDTIGAGKHAWFLMIGSPAELIGRMPETAAGGALRGDIIQSIEQMSGSLYFGQNVEMTAQAVTKDEASAQALTNVVQFLVSFAQLSSDPETAKLLAGAISSMELTAEGNRATVSLSIPEDDFETLLDRFRARHQRLGPEKRRDRDARDSENRTGRQSRGGAASR